MADPHASLTDREKAYILRVIARTHSAITDIYRKRTDGDASVISSVTLRVLVLAESAPHQMRATSSA